MWGVDHKSKRPHCTSITSESKIECVFISWILIEISWIFRTGDGFDLLSSCRVVVVIGHRCHPVLWHLILDSRAGILEKTSQLFTIAGRLGTFSPTEYWSSQSTLFCLHPNLSRSFGRSIRRDMSTLEILFQKLTDNIPSRSHEVVSLFLAVLAHLFPEYCFPSFSDQGGFYL